MSGMSSLPNRCRPLLYCSAKARADKLDDRVEWQLMGSLAEARHLALEVQSLSVGFDRTTVIGQLSFDVPHGSALAIIGPNGAGKSVLIKALIGVLPSEGEISWEANTKIGYVPHEGCLLSAATLNISRVWRSPAAVAPAIAKRGHDKQKHADDPQQPPRAQHLRARFFIGDRERQESFFATRQHRHASCV
jgi:ATPase subunit of ABC transporter with duplicated ATPase domains